ncbi:hypothetical protein AMJ50_01760 [Parcubacteria bacterium DG_74_3]|nr:MAG: hypothetical protein AMJ50_01760 [Parcubacteria bacterium DG_74_3]
MKFTTKSQYGLRAMVYLAKAQNKISPLKIISEKEGIPFNYLEKIISDLEGAGFLQAKRGIGGGYFLALEPKEIKVGEIIKALEGSLAPVKCLIKDKKRRYSCPRQGKCQTRRVWKKIQTSLNSTLDSITLADLI